VHLKADWKLDKISSSLCYSRNTHNVTGIAVDTLLVG